MATAQQIRNVADLLDAVGGHRHGKHRAERVDACRAARLILDDPDRVALAQVSACADLLEVEGKARAEAIERARLELSTLQIDITPAHLFGTPAQWGPR